MTTRTQVLRQAVQVSDPLSRANFDPAEVVLQVAQYDTNQRAQILYNHLYFSTLPRDVLRDYVSTRRYREVVNHSNFSPRIVELVVKRTYTSATDLANDLNRALDRPLDLYRTTFAHAMLPVAQRIVFSLLTFPMPGVRSKTLKSAARGAATPIEYSSALRTLEGTFVRFEKDRYGDRDVLVLFANPGVRDFALAFLEEEPDYLLEILTTAHTVGQVTQLLGYASSSEGERSKFPQIAKFVSHNRLLILERLNDLTQEHESSTVSVAPLVRSLATIKKLMPDEFDAVLLLATRVVASGSVDDMEGEEFSEFCEILLAHRPGNVVQYRAAMEYALKLWGEALGYLEQVNEYIEFFDRLRASPDYWDDLDDVLCDAVERGLVSDLDLLSSTPRDLEPDEVPLMRDHLNDIERVARHVGVLNLIQRQLDRVRSVDDGRGSSDAVAQVQAPPPPGPPVWTVPKTSTHRKVEIDEIFEELS